MPLPESTNGGQENGSQGTLQNPESGPKGSPHDDLQETNRSVTTKIPASGYEDHQVHLNAGDGCDGDRPTRALPSEMKSWP